MISPECENVTPLGRVCINLLCDLLVYGADGARSIHISENGILVYGWDERVVIIDVIRIVQSVTKAGFFELLQKSVRDQGTRAQIDAWSWLAIFIFQ